MKIRHVVSTCLFSLAFSVTLSQQTADIFSRFEQHLEEYSEKEDGEYEDDYLLLKLKHLLDHPVNINTASEEDLRDLPFLTNLQVENFVQYRRLLGKFLSIYELQAIPYWNPERIHQLLPYIKLNNDKSIIEGIRNRWKGGSHSLLLRSSMVLEKAQGYEKGTANNGYNGDPARLYVRYLYNYKNELQWGILGDKDAGEQFFGKKQKAGFDFYSFHFFLKDTGLIKSLAIGDFRVNMGQGLIQWQSVSFGKSLDMAGIIRHSPVLLPYNAPAESGFHRGAGLTLQKKNVEATAFFSKQKISANLDTDSLDHAGKITSLLTSGYHRTAAEMADKNNINQLSAGGTIKYSTTKGHLSLNGIYYKLSHPFGKADKPYNLYQPNSNSFFNGSVDYSLVYKNMFIFGEFAADKNNHKALLNGVLLAMDPKVDFVLIHRRMDKDYQSIYSKAFTENTSPANEIGIFAGLILRPSSSVSVHINADIFRFPWLKYRVDAPSGGKEYQARFNYSPNKLVHVTSSYRFQQKSINQGSAGNTTSFIGDVTKLSSRFQVDLFLSKHFRLRNRCEVNWYNKSFPSREEGFLIFTDFLYKQPLRSWSANARLMFFETGGYNSRIYAFENDVLYSFSAPALFDKGFRYYLNMHWNVSSLLADYRKSNIKLDCWFRFARTSYYGKSSTGTGPDLISGNKKTEIKLQLMLVL